MGCNTAFLVIAICSVTPFWVRADQRNGDVAQQEVKKVQGTWQVTKWIEASEEALPPDEIKEATVEFNGNKLIIREKKKDSGKEVNFALDPTKEPKWIDVEGLRSSPGIYKLEGDVLTICVVSGSKGGKDSPRPTEFKASKENVYTLFVLKKIKK